MIFSDSFSTHSVSPLKKGGGLTIKSLHITKAWSFVANYSLPIFLGGLGWVQNQLFFLFPFRKTLTKQHWFQIPDIQIK